MLAFWSIQSSSDRTNGRYDRSVGRKDGLPRTDAHTNTLSTFCSDLYLNNCDLLNINCELIHLLIRRPSIIWNAVIIIIEPVLSVSRQPQKHRNLLFSSFSFPFFELSLIAHSLNHHHLYHRFVTGQHKRHRVFTGHPFFSTDCRRRCGEFRLSARLEKIH